MKLQELQDTFDRARDAITVKRVFGEPYQQNGVTVIPAASVAGGAGGGEGEGGEGGEGKGANKGIGGGFGVVARPAGVYLIKGETVAWRPALDLNRVIAGAQQDPRTLTGTLGDRRRHGADPDRQW
jgi:uncharacterized spore protein YtfJ